MTYIVRHLAHQLGRDFMKDVLQVDDVFLGLERANDLSQYLGKGNVGENTEVGRVEKAQAGLSLSLPHVTIGVDDAPACT